MLQIGVMLATELRKISDIAIIGPNTLALRIPSGYNASGNQYLDNSRLAKVEEALTKIVGQPCSLRLETEEAKPGDRKSAANNTEPSLPSSVKKQRQRTEIAQVPLVGKAMQTLGGQIVQMDDEFGVANTEDNGQERD